MSETNQNTRTVTVSDLRLQFAEVEKWIEDGEQVTITRYGVPFATLTPARTEKPCKVDWAARFKQRPLLGRKLTRKETQVFYDDMKGEY
jgi:antitoxin (DNA-binding transcriptional repressor) of toxin-antitoxin stability system